MRFGLIVINFLNVAANDIWILIQLKNPIFSEILIASIKHRYGTLVPATKLADDLDRITEGEISLSSEAIRKWLRGKSIPSGNALLALDDLLGDYFVRQRKLKKSNNSIANSLDAMDIRELMETQRMIHTRIENSFKQVLPKSNYKPTLGDAE